MRSRRGWLVTTPGPVENTVRESPRSPAWNRIPRSERGDASSNLAVGVLPLVIPEPWVAGLSPSSLGATYLIWQTALANWG